MKEKTLLKKWADAVKERDGNECKICKAVDKLHAHHIVPRKKDKNLWYEINNGVTLCSSCHAKTEGFQKGHKLSEESKKRMCEKIKGRRSWNFGGKLTPEHIEKLKKSHLGQVAWNKGKKSLRPAWNKGIRASEHVKKSLLAATIKTWEKRKKEGIPGPRQGTKTSEEVKRKISESVKRAHAEGKFKKGLKHV